MSGRAPFHARKSVRVGAAVTASALVAGGVLATQLAPTTAATGTAKLTREQVAETLLERRGEFLSPGAQAGLRYLAGRNRPAGLVGEGDAPGEARAAGTAAQAAEAPSAGLKNVRVNDPRTDKTLEQTTQSETALAVRGKRVVVGFNDSQHVYPGGFLTAGANLTGVAWSADGGRTFTDAGNLPQGPGQINLGDPWLGVDRKGTFYFSELVISGESGGLEIGVSTSKDGARWTVPTYASPNDPALFYSGDKEALTVGRSKASAGKDTVYVAWDDFVDDGQGGFFAGLPVARSQDGGKTFDLAYADKITSDPSSCSFGQYIGSQPSVDPATGDLTVVSVRIGVDDPTCEGGTEAFDIVSVTSTDGGVTFGRPVVVATVSDFADIDLGPGRVARNLPLPTVTRLGSTVVAAWNEGAKGAMRTLWSASKDGGATWSPTVAVPSPAGEDFQPALSSDAAGLHLAAYHKNPDLSIDVLLSDSKDGTAWATRRVTTKAFPGVYNNPQFDPVIATGYMGDYIANVATGGSLYLAWGDNRDIVKNALWTAGRNDPDVFFAKR